MLNARGHRGGDDFGERDLLRERGWDVLNARGHRGGDDTHSPTRSRRGRCAQRPRASRRRRRGNSNAPVAGGAGAQRPRASRRRRHSLTTSWGDNRIGCSTPEGIEAATTDPEEDELAGPLVLNARGHRGGDDGRNTASQARVGEVLNARGHRGGDDNSLSSAQDLARRCSTPEGIEAATTWHQWRARPERNRVLNARGHRGGDDSRRPTERLVREGECSTPEGIEAATTFRSVSISHELGVCSTPEGIEAATTWTATPAACRARSAQRPRASRRRRHRRAERLDRRDGCSTPEGIEAATTAGRSRRHSGTCGAQRPRASRRRRLAWNKPKQARRRLCSTPEGIEAATTATSTASARARFVCSTPEGIEAATTRRPRGTCGALIPRAQRPRASRRRRLAPVERVVPGHRVLNARGHRGGDDDIQRNVEVNGNFVCSTPEGIEAATTPRRARPRPTRCGGAQRPRASRRRRPRGRRARLHPRPGVLNARGHRGGDDSHRRFVSHSPHLPT